MMGLPAFQEFIAGPWKTACYDQCKLSTRIRMESALRTQLLPTFGDLPLDQIDSSAVRLWFDSYSQTAPGGANRTLDVMRQIFSYACRCGYIQCNPTRSVKANPRRKLTRFLSRTEIDRLHVALNAHHGRESGRQQVEIIRLLLLTGCRKSELIHLRWSEIDGNALHLTDGKTGPRLIFLNSQARAILVRQPRADSPYVFPSPYDSAKSRSKELSLWRKVRRKAGIQDARLHDLRHTFASHAVMQGVPLPVLSRLLGHSRTRMTLRYAHVSNREIEAAAERIGVAIASLLVETGSQHGNSFGNRDPKASLDLRVKTEARRAGVGQRPSSLA